MHGGFELAKLRTREPNGRLQREPQHSPGEVKRLRDAAMRGLRDPEWGTELGRLFLERAITAEMYAAGKRWRTDAATYRGAIDVFQVRTGSLERGAQSYPPDPDSDEGRKRASRERAAVEQFFAAHSALVLAGLGAESAVRKLCEEDGALAGLYEFNNARRGLSKLADHYKKIELTGSGKSANVR